MTKSQKARLMRAEILLSVLGESGVDDLLSGEVSPEEQAVEELETNANPRGCNQYKGCGTGANTARPAVGTKMDRDEVVTHIMRHNPPEHVKSGKMTQEEWADTYLSKEPGGYVVAKVSPAVMHSPTELGEPHKIPEFVKKSGEDAPAIVVDSNDKMQARFGGSKLDQAYGLQPHTVVDGKHRVAAAVARGDKTILAIVPERKLAQINSQSRRHEMSQFAREYAESRGLTDVKIIQDTYGPRLLGKTVEGYSRDLGPTDLERIAQKRGHQFDFPSDTGGVTGNSNPGGCNQYKKCGTGGKADEEEARRAEQFRQMAKRSRGEAPPSPTQLPTPPTSPIPTPAPTASTYPPLKPAPRGSGYSLPSPQEAVRTVKREDVDTYLTAARKVADRGRAHLHHVAGETGWDEGKLAHVASAAYGLGLAPLRAYEGPRSEKEKRWSFENEGDHLGVVHIE